MNALNTLVVRTLPFIPKAVVRQFANRYIAGETLAEAVACVRQLNTEGVLATMDVLGEDVFTEEDANRSRDASIDVLHAIARERLGSNLSIKLTSLGLKLNLPFCTENVRRILTVAAGYGTFVRFDMEDSTCTTDTIGIFRSLQEEFPNTGIVLQAYMRRSAEDTRLLMTTRTNFRLCKGIYKERPEVALQGREEVQQNFLALLEMMLRGGSYVGIATHDTVLVDGAEALIRRLGKQKSEFEFQMLLGVRPELRRKLVRAGYTVRLYVPFGRSWYGYSTRRFKENPEIAGYVFKALFTRNA